MVSGSSVREVVCISKLPSLITHRSLYGPHLLLRCLLGREKAQKHCRRSQQSIHIQADCTIVSSPCDMCCAWSVPCSCSFAPACLQALVFEVPKHLTSCPRSKARRLQPTCHCFCCVVHTSMPCRDAPIPSTGLPQAPGALLCPPPLPASRCHG
jgi:hypothetical protein